MPAEIADDGLIFEPITVICPIRAGRAKKDSKNNAGSFVKEQLGGLSAEALAKADYWWLVFRSW
jgi:hypothetical protein